MPVRIVAVCTALAAVVLLPSTVRAQYKNQSFGFDAAYGINARPTVVDSDGDLLDLGNRPIRLFMGGRIGAEYNYKMSADHWWLAFRANFGLWTFGGDANGSLSDKFDAEANRVVGTVLAIQGAVGIRYVIFTDRIRPYVQLSVSYLRLVSFMDASSTCNEVICGSAGQSNYQAYFPHENAIGVHFQPGLEWVFTRDVALHVFVDTAAWFTINTLPVGNFNPGLGVVFFL